MIVRKLKDKPDLNIVVSEGLAEQCNAGGKYGLLDEV